MGYVKRTVVTNCIKSMFFEKNLFITPQACDGKKRSVMDCDMGSCGVILPANNTNDDWPQKFRDGEL